MADWHLSVSSSTPFTSTSSDSSMADWHTDSAACTILAPRSSDSSMADWHNQRLPLKEYVTYVQIPLWPIGTANPIPVSGTFARFRFLYGRLALTVGPCILIHPAAFRFLYGRLAPFSTSRKPIRILCSDSSMADWHVYNTGGFTGLFRVQIPLWPIGTGPQPPRPPGKTRFRFLYGRLAPRKWFYHP